MATIKKKSVTKKKKKKVLAGCRDMEHICIAGDNVRWYITIMNNNMAVPQKVKQLS